MTALEHKRRVFSGIQPTGTLHIGNYIGAIQVWVANQAQWDSIFCIVDLHALTIPEAVDPVVLRAKTRELAAVYLACGLDPSHAALFLQSHIAAHAELNWLLTCVTPVGWLERMTQYKTKAGQRSSVSTGLLAYPVLQAADVLLYDTEVVPVGDDQQQHIELARDIAQRFNTLYGEVFVLPAPLIRASGARIMGLDDPTAKMSKSVAAVRPGHAVGLVDPPEVIRKAIMGAVTDGGQEIRFAEASAGVGNLMVLYETLSGQDRPTIEARFAGKGYGVLKREVVEVVSATLVPIRQRYLELMDDPTYVEAVLTAGAERVRPLAEATLARAKQQVGVG